MTWVNVPAAIAMVLMLCLYTRRSVEIAIPLAISLAMPALLVLAAVRALSYVDWLSAALLAGAGAWLVRGIRTGRVTRTAACTFLKEQVFTPGLACFALLGVFWTLANQDRAVLNYDEYSYWATQVRSLYVSDGLVGGARTCCMEHAAYPPGMQLLEWWFMHLRGLWHEGTLYAAAFWLNSAFLLPLARRITWRRWWQAGLFAVGVVALPTVLTGHAYSMLATDTTLGVIFGALMCILWTEGRAPHAPLTAGALMTALVLSKQTGILWAALGMAFLLTTQGRQALRSRRWLTACAAPLVMLALWQAYCRMEGLGSMHLERMLSASPVWDEVLWAWEWIVKTLLIRPLNRSGGWDGMMPLAGLPAAVWAALFCGAILWRVKGPLRGRCILFAAGTFALYALVVMGSAATVFALAGASRAADRGRGPVFHPVFLRDGLLDGASHGGCACAAGAGRARGDRGMRLSGAGADRKLAESRLLSARRVCRALPHRQRKRLATRKPELVYPDRNAGRRAGAGGAGHRQLHALCAGPGQSGCDRRAVGGRRRGRGAAGAGGRGQRHASGGDGASERPGVCRGIGAGGADGHALPD